jgi:cytochrome c oxidase subunit 1
LPLGFNYTDIPLHDTYYVIGHFHYVVAPGTIFAIFAGIYHWYPKVTGRFLNEFWGKVHFWLSLIFMNLIFLPMFAQGLAGMHRRMYDGGATYAGAADPSAGVVGLPQFVFDLNRGISHAAWLLGLAQVPFIINFFVSLTRGRKAGSDNPWGATTLEWQTPTPPPHGNFTRPVQVHRGPYDYSLPGEPGDFAPQNQPVRS